MSEPRFRSDIAVRKVMSAGDDQTFAEAAWVVDPETPWDDRRTGPTDVGRVLKAMLKGRHGTPFEHGLMTVYVEAPVVVWWEWTRHRFMSLGCPDLGFNLESGRYRVLDGVFYLPPERRPCKEPDGFKPMRPELEFDIAAHEEAVGGLKATYFRAWSDYQLSVSRGVSREVARMGMPFGLYYAGYVSANPRTWLQFFSLRRSDPRAAVATFPQWEIQKADEACESLFARQWPATYDLFNELGRVAP